jgi:transposase
MVPYSIDLRERVLRAVDLREGTQEEIARRFRVSARWIRKLLARRAATGSIAPAPHGGGRQLLIQGESAEALRVAVRNDPDATLAELRQATGIQGCLRTFWRALDRLKITRKKSLPVASLCAVWLAQATFLCALGTFQAGNWCWARQAASSPWRRAASSTASDTTPASVHSMP